jgi:hypothetical protein
LGWPDVPRDVSAILHRAHCRTIVASDELPSIDTLTNFSRSRDDALKTKERCAVWNVDNNTYCE